MGYSGNNSRYASFEKEKLHGNIFPCMEYYSKIYAGTGFPDNS